MSNATPLVTDYCCPRCHGDLMVDGDSLRCSDGNCSLSAAGSFPIVKGQPILVDFETRVRPRDHGPQRRDGRCSAGRTLELDGRTLGLEEVGSPPFLR